ncbi:gliding motility-associated protein GldE [Pontibacter roseus]|uniref:gliding motility-associated protein GldE n=1 Tax=Pontibacter roseus TaxID=336989 RepID=UPI00036D11A7|nr:gliding motility-associated protein GldE [Pontibacter roseus]
MLQLLQSASALLKIEYIAATAACFILLLLSALTSGAEAAFFSLTDQDLEKSRRSTHKSQQLVYHLLQSPRQLLASLLIINNALNVSIITLSAYIAWKIFGTTSMAAPVMVVSLLLVTFLIVFFGGVLPKVYARKYGYTIAQRMAPILESLRPMLSPVAWLLTRISSFIDRRYRTRSYSKSLEELHHSLDVALSNEETSPEERKILRGIVNFGSITVKQIMRPRMDIVAFPRGATLPELLPQITQWGYSRVPVYRHSTDQIDGILYVKDLLPHLGKGADFNWQRLIRLPFFVPETKHISDLLQDFKEKHVHMAIVVNEYGTTTGLLTMEDVVEEVVGEINDEYDDEEEIIYSQLDENTFIFDGKTSLHDFCKITEIPFDAFNGVKNEHETVAGLMLALFGRIPTVGEDTTYGRYHFTIESADTKRIKRVKINVTSKKENYHKVS